MKLISLIALLALFSSTVFAQQRMRPDGMGGWVVEDAGECEGALCGYMRGKKEQQQQQLQQEQIENQRLQNEILRRKLEQEKSASQSSQQAPQVNNFTPPEFQNWQSANPWFGRDHAKTEFAKLYAKQLRQERPDLIGRPFLDAVTAKVVETFSVEK